MGVIGVAIGKLPDPVIGRRFRKQGLEIIDQLLVGRIDLGGNRVFHPLLIIRALRFIQVSDLCGPRFERSREDVSRGRLGDESAHFLEYILDHEPRRNDPFVLPQMQTFESLIELRRQGAEPLEIIIAIPRVEQPVSVGHEGGKLVLHAEELVHGIVVKLEALAFDLPGQKPIENMGREPLRLCLPGERIGAQLRQVFPPARRDLLLMGRRLVV